MRMTPLEFRQDLWRRQTRVAGLSYGVVCVIPVLTVFVELRHMTDERTDDGRTDRRTHDGAIYLASVASRGKWVNGANAGGADV